MVFSCVMALIGVSFGAFYKVAVTLWGGLTKPVLITTRIGLLIRPSIYLLDVS
jgi:hypothetical protein